MVLAIQIIIPVSFVYVVRYQWIAIGYYFNTGDMSSPVTSACDRICQLSSAMSFLKYRWIKWSSRIILTFYMIHTDCVRILMRSAANIWCERKLYDWIFIYDLWIVYNYYGVNLLKQVYISVSMFYIVAAYTVV